MKELYKTPLVKTVIVDCQQPINQSSNLTTGSLITDDPMGDDSPGFGNDFWD